VKFSYIALNKDYKKLTGVLAADDMLAARKALHAMNLSVISLQEADESAEVKSESDDPNALKEEKIGETFYFRVQDNKNEERTGTIDAIDRYDAFSRLVKEYKFHVLGLCLVDLPPEERAEAETDGLWEMEKDLSEELGVENLYQIEKKKSQEEAISDELSEKQSEKEKENRIEIMDKVEGVLSYANHLLQSDADEIAAADIDAVRKNINLLSRMRLSNNLNYIKTLSNELMEAVEQAIRNKYDKQREKVMEGVSTIPEPVRPANTEGFSGKLNLLKYGIEKYMYNSQKKKSSSTFQQASSFKFNLIIKRYLELVGLFFQILFSGNAKERRFFWRNLAKKHKEIIKLSQTPAVDLLFQRQFVEQGGISDIIEQWNEKQRQRRERHQKILDTRKNVMANRRGRVKQKTDNTNLSETPFNHLLEEVHLFLGWLLSFYILYFYASFYLLTKFDQEGTISNFLLKTLNSNFPFMVTGLIFIIFAGITIKLRYAVHSHLVAFLTTVGTGFCLLVFVLNF